MTQIKISPLPDNSEFMWECPSCKYPNIMDKVLLSENREYPCDGVNCQYKFAIKSFSDMPDSLRHWLLDREPVSNIDQRPRITGR